MYMHILTAGYLIWKGYTNKRDNVRADWFEWEIEWVLLESGSENIIFIQLASNNDRTHTMWWHITWIDRDGR